MPWCVHGKILLIGLVSQFLSNPGRKPVLVGYTDEAGDLDSRKSTSGYLIRFTGGAVSWQSRVQKCLIHHFNIGSSVSGGTARANYLSDETGTSLSNQPIPL
ncbi:Retrovirus-related Pol polyprotein from transposon TNT 1-94 [Cucumis melo var. makuwa]|uniref:Retrovirus-related Pol polyprotein from transposon TNT 1-94 n=1 Tax=Cucumis melo var. makuwa TaxID=1194695 RepID=A0A5A7U4B2_CUCMM|nr:Retrovirus-related Pol polyprotein from transposon TNT 1-94 [Cucumis melo var. makuwa]TYJ99877.1 Retrovirus-related Pol polyprotein from transposon TNT 1-94 [Cucumis melo var. makuwa]